MDQASVLTKSDYSLKTYNINKDNKWSAFHQKGKGVFFIHPGERKPSRGVFEFKDSGKIFLYFSIRKGSKVGNIEFAVKKNGDEIKKLIITPKQKQQMTVSVQKSDKLEIIADKHGGIGQDWGNLKVKVQEKAYNLKFFIIPFLWAILFIFLLGKNHKYIGINAYVGFVLILFAEKLNFGPLTYNSILIYMLFIFAMTFIFTLIYQELTILKKYKIASIVSYVATISIYIIPLLFIIYALNNGTAVSKDIMYAVFQSNTEESMEYISDFIALKYIMLFIFITTFVGFLLYQQEKKETQKIEKSLLIFLIITFLSISLIQFSHLRLPDFLIGSFERYNYELAQFKEIQEKRKYGKIKFTSKKTEKDETYVIVIGESLNKKHMGIYGYLRKTTPNLTRIKHNNELLLFNNTYSNHAYTVGALSKALTESNQYNKKNYYDSLSIIDILKEADIENFWLTNQVIYGAWDNLVSVIGRSSDNLVAMNKHIGKQLETNQFDGALIGELKKVLSRKGNKTRVVFIHLIGSHWRYSTRYPHDKFTIYKGSLKVGEYGTEASKNDSINDYDNSVAYNDYVVSSLLDELQKTKGVTGFIYMPDHAEDAIGKLAHFFDKKFTFEMLQIPMIAWFSDAYKKRYPEKYKIFQQHTETLFSNDMLYDTLIGLFGVQTDRYSAQYDLSSNNYKLDPKDALALHSKKHYTSKNNHLYWQKVNAKYLIDTNQSARIFPYRVNSIGKLKDVWNDGFRSFKIDIQFGEDNATTFRMGLNSPLAGVSFEKFLNSIESSEIEQIILSLHNLDKGNYQNVLAKLEYFGDKYHLKSKIIVEFGTKGEFFKEFSDNGWHTSYTLPEETIAKLLKERNDKEMEALSLEISNQIKQQQLSGLSFDRKIYPFVKKYLEPRLSGEEIYHVWHAPALYDIDFKKKLLKDKFYLDERVKTLLGSYDSQFEL